VGFHRKDKKGEKSRGGCAEWGWGFRHDYKIDKIVWVVGILSKKRGLGCPRPELLPALYALLTKKACFFDKIALVDGILQIL
jgi:hypothetical protein